MDGAGGWELQARVDGGLEEEMTERLVEYNKSRSEIVRRRFEPANLRSEPVQVFALATDGALIGGCAARVERLWHWLTIDTMWVDQQVRGRRIGLELLRAVEDEGRQRGCRWAEVTTFDFQAPGFYLRAGYEEYAVKHDYPPGHSNHFFRKNL
ncbi:GNAT family N-acetyltransferase [Kribbella sp. VKM Ac-2568]|uniref:GNAT family N-acetyltransferase n=1 Tax=Kribbella sp. VKM Ac-2568 TaxID=2512219 RepID=UPI00104E885B|nr:GNAT family N-acetyltransferase [Kribbella sp. VKM Ac-2568]TCM51200.1 acetyltransferase (GNAT) family protein [Kribbella sp. VKM Ac-2568]